MLSGPIMACWSCTVALQMMIREMIPEWLQPCMYHRMQIYHFKILTTAVQSIFINLVSSVTAALEAPNSVITTMFTASICSGTFIDVYRATTHQNFTVY